MTEADIVDGTVEGIEPFGIYVETEAGRVLVLITDLGEHPVRHPDEVFAVGDRVRVRLIRFVREKSLYKGSLVPHPFNE